MLLLRGSTHIVELVYAAVQGCFAENGQQAAHRLRSALPGDNVQHCPLILRQIGDILIVYLFTNPAYQISSTSGRKG
jgi:hypothetical protein